MSEPKEHAKMELLSLEPSPYSKRVVWALRKIDFDYIPSQYTSIAGEPALRWRLGRWNPWTPATVPIGFVTDAKGKEMALENGIDIVEWADERGSPKKNSPLIPKDQRSEVLKYCKLADDFQNFDRSMFLKALSHDPPKVLRAVAGDGPPDAALRVIAFVVGTFMRTKYRSTLQAGVPEIRDKLDTVTQHLSTKQDKKPGSLVFLVGDNLTLADIFMSVAICGGVQDRSKPKSEHEINQQEAMARQGFAMKEAYPLLYQWAVEISEKHG